jgi:hypothetical protein
MTDYKEMLLKKQAQLLDSYNQVLGAIQVLNELIDELNKSAQDHDNDPNALTMDELKRAIGAQSVEVIENES